jgi:ABC-2 type transport system permease protein
LALNNLVGTGLQNHLQFLDSTKSFHEKLRLCFYEKIFENQPVNSVDWKNIKPEYFSARQYIQWVSILLPLLLISVLLLGMAQYNFYRPTKINTDTVQ